MGRQPRLRPRNGAPPLFYSSNLKSHFFESPKSKPMGQAPRAPWAGSRKEANDGPGDRLFDAQPLRTLSHDAELSDGTTAFRLKAGLRFLNQKVTQSSDNNYITCTQQAHRYIF